MTTKELNKLQYEIIGAAIEVHKHMGAGLLESVYHRCMKSELTKRGIKFESEVRINVRYKDEVFEDEVLRCDLLVEKAIVVELKAIEAFAPIHQTILLTYMRLQEKPKGLLINFTCENIVEEGYKSFVNEYYRLLPD
ncbi:MAG TPA: GxxExxY protein [Flavobacteriales bacterium]|nr:GxxExxY protein [Flavobacteriales bacterium]